MQAEELPSPVCQGNAVKIASITLLLAALLPGHPVLAQIVTPTLSGTYAYMETVRCGASFSSPSEQVLVPSDSKVANAVSSMSQTQSGLLAVGVGYITFTPSSANTGAVKGSNTTISIASFAINGAGLNMQLASPSFSGIKYSLNIAAGTVKFGTQKYTLSVGGIDALGLVHTAYLVRQSTNSATNNPNCIDGMTAEFQNGQ